MNDPYMVYIHDDTGVEARWSGGAYIDLGYTDEAGEFHANSVINVYDYAKGETSIPFSTDSMKEAVDEHLLPEPECGDCGSAMDDLEVERDRRNAYDDVICDQCADEREDDEEEDEDDDEDEEPTDDQIYNRPGMEGGIPYKLGE